MNDSFFSLRKNEQAEIIDTIAPELGISSEVIEKDIWICLLLGVLFEIPGVPPMAFKGGTSLSKVYNAIERFSEDIDITIHHEGLIPETSAFGAFSRNKMKTVSEKLREALNELLREKILPNLKEKLPTDGELSFSPEQATISFSYPSCLPRESNPYIKRRVLIEFGGRNSVEPKETVRIKPYLSERLANLRFPEATVEVLKGTRTFWEKATLIHAEINRREPRRTWDRLSRHWYDLYRLAGHDIGARALAEDFYILEDVVRYKKAFFRRNDVHYDDCLNRTMRLIPEGETYSLLERDYKEMVEAGMFYGLIPTFGEISNRLKELEEQINRHPR